MAEITDEQRATLSAVGRKLVLPRLELSAESRLARQAFEAYLDWNDRIAAHRERDDVQNQMADVESALGRLHFQHEAGCRREREECCCGVV